MLWLRLMKKPATAFFVFLLLQCALLGAMDNIAKAEEIQTGIVTLVVTDEDGDSFLEGAKFNLYYSDGRVLQRDLLTDAEGRLRVENLPAGSYFFRQISASEGYGPAEKTISFVINEENAGIEQEIAVYNAAGSKSIEILSKIPAASINFDNGDPIFLFKVAGGNKERYAMVKFDREYVEANTDSDGYVSQTTAVSGLAAEIYTVSQEGSNRYTAEKSTVDLTSADSGSTVFLSEKHEYGGFTDAKSQISILKANAKMTKMQVEWLGDSEVQAKETIDRDLVKVTVFYDDGTKRVLERDEWSFGDGFSDETFPNQNGETAVPVTYSENGITKTGSFKVTVTGEVKGIASLEASVKDEYATVDAGSSLTNDMFTVKAIYNGGDVVTLAIENYVLDINKAPDTDGSFTVKISLAESFEDYTEGIWAEVELVAKRSEQAFAIYSADDTSLRFYKDFVPTEDTYEGRTVTAIFTGIEENEYANGGVPWYADYGTSITTVVVEDEINPVSTANWFYGLTNCQSLDVSHLNVTGIKAMENMFYLTGMNSAVTAFQITGLDNWDVSSVENMNSMFSSAGQNASDWDIGDLSYWNVSNVNDMWGMFFSAGRNASSFSIGDLSDWNVSSVTDMSYMFSSAGYKAATFDIGDLDNWNVSSVGSMWGLFSSAGRNATTWNVGDLSKWNTASVTNMNYMFSLAGYKATTFDIGNLDNWNTASVNSMSYMFSSAGRSAKIWNIGDLSKWNTASVTDMSSMFSSAGRSATTWDIGDLGNWNTASVTNMSSMFLSAGVNSSTFSLNLSGWSTESVTTMESMFLGCRTLGSITLGEKWAWVGTDCYLPEPSSTYITGADGYWYDAATMTAYAPEDIPSNKAATYVASINLASVDYSALSLSEEIVDMAEVDE